MRIFSVQYEHFPVRYEDFSVRNEDFLIQYEDFLVQYEELSMATGARASRQKNVTIFSECCSNGEIIRNREQGRPWWASSLATCMLDSVF